MRSLLLVVALAAAPAPGSAQTSAPASSSAAPAAASSQLEQDVAALKVAQDAFAKGGFPTLAGHLSALEAVLGRAPAHLQAVEEGPDQVVFTGQGLPAYLAFTAWEQAKWKEARQAPRPIVWRPSPYPTAALYLGSYYDELGRFDQALVYLQKGLAFAPDDPTLITEAGLALAKLGRLDEALSLYDRGLADAGDFTGANFIGPKDEARMLRGKGFALTELGRLDEAERAYKDSLKLEPDHQGAKNELIYIAQLRAGAAPTESQIMTTDKARNVPPPLR